jgi:Predicted integral membrane protein
MFFRKTSWLFVCFWLIVIFMMSHLDSVKSWYLTGEVLTVVKTGSLDQEASFDEKMTSYSSNENSNLMHILRKSAHFLEYFILALLLMNALLFHLDLLSALRWALGIGIVYGILDELHQLLIPGRTCNIVDMMIDGFGVCIGCLCVVLLKRFRKVSTYEN